jgi:hypothetical membrane protein
VNVPSAWIFDGSVFILGAAALLAGISILRSHQRTTGLLTLIGSAGAMGVGLFPETTGGLHVLVSFVAFFFTGLAAISSYRMLGSPMSYFAVVLGAFTLVALVLYGSGTFLGLGPGGMERMVAYPAVIWVIGAGGSLIGSPGQRVRNP